MTIKTRTPNSQLSEKLSISFWISILSAILVGSFFPRLMAYLPGIIGLVFFLILFFRHNTLIKLEKNQIIFTALFLTLAGMSVLWSINPEISISRTLKLGAIIIPSLFLLNIAKNTYKFPKIPAIKLLFAVYFTVASFLIFEQLSGHFIIHQIVDYHIIGAILNRSYVIFALLSLITLYASQKLNLDRIKKIILAIFILLISIYALYLSISQTAQLTFLCGLFFLILFPIQNRNLGKVLFSGILILCFSLPFILKPIQNTIPEDVLLKGFLKEASIIYRFDVWNFTITEIEKNPLYGHGIESQRSMKADQWMEHQKADSILHAHNVILQIWIEFGVLGILLGSAFLIYCFKSIYDTEDLNKRRLYLTMFTALFCCAMTGYGFWQSWQVGAFFIFSAAIISMTRVQKT